MKQKLTKGAAPEWAVQILAVLVVAILIVAVVWGGARLASVIYRDTAPRQMQAEREVYVQTPSYVNAKNGIIAKYIMQYKAAKSDLERHTIRESIIYEAATVDTNNLTPQIQSFLKTL